MIAFPELGASPLRVVGVEKDHPGQATIFRAKLKLTRLKPMVNTFFHRTYHQRLLKMEYCSGSTKPRNPMNSICFRRFQVLARCDSAPLVARMVNTCEACRIFFPGEWSGSEWPKWKARNRSGLQRGVSCPAAPLSLAGEAPCSRKLRNQNGQSPHLGFSDARLSFRGKRGIQGLRIVGTWVDIGRLKTWQEILQKS